MTACAFEALNQLSNEFGLRLQCLEQDYEKARQLETSAGDRYADQLLERIREAKYVNSCVATKLHEVMSSN